MTSSTTSPRLGEAHQSLDPTPPVAECPGRSPEDGETVPGEADCVRLLEYAIEALQTAAGAGDADLARACRIGLASLAVRRPGNRSATRPAEGPNQGPPAAPRWARRSVAEDGGIVHETVSPIHPEIKIDEGHGWEPMSCDVSLSVTDLLIDDRWIRTLPSVQVEGGSYSLGGARRLLDALHHLLGLHEGDGLADLAR